MNDNIKSLLQIVAILLIVVAIVWCNFFAPCQWFSIVKASQIPARCLSYFGK